MLDAFRERKQKVRVAIQAVGEFARQLGATTLAQRIERDLNQKLAEDRFHLVIVGEFNHGKSTFINALLGGPVVPVGVTPTTAVIHHIRYADTPESQVVYASGRRETIPFDQIRTFAVGGRATTDEVDFLEIGVAAPLLREQVLLVDTPGVNDLSLQRADVTYSYIPRADAVLFLLDAGQILKESERVFLEGKILKSSREKIIFVITKWDLLTPGERDEAFAYAQEKLRGIVGEPTIYPVSAEAALDGRPELSGMPALLDYMTQFLAEERGRIILDNALRETMAIGLLLRKGVDARRRSLAMKTEELNRRIAVLERDLEGQSETLDQRRSRIREQVGGIKVGARKDLERFVDDTLRQLPGVIDAASASDLKQFLPAFLEETFTKWAEAETREIAGSLEALAEQTIALVRDDAHVTGQRITDLLGGSTPKLEVNVDTMPYDMGVVALLTLGIGVMFGNLMLGGFSPSPPPSWRSRCETGLMASTRQKPRNWSLAWCAKPHRKSAPKSIQ